MMMMKEKMMTFNIPSGLYEALTSTPNIKPILSKSRVGVDILFIYKSVTINKKAGRYKISLSFAVKKTKKQFCSIELPGLPIIAEVISLTKSKSIEPSLYEQSLNRYDTPNQFRNTKSELELKIYYDKIHSIETHKNIFNLVNSGVVELDSNNINIVGRWKIEHTTSTTQGIRLMLIKI